MAVLREFDVLLGGWLPPESSSQENQHWILLAEAIKNVPRVKGGDVDPLLLSGRNVKDFECHVFKVIYTT